MVKVLIGADPEFFLIDKITKKNVSAHGLVPGTKKKPHKLECGAVQLDGTAVEFNIDPAATAFEFEYNITHVVKQIRDMIPDTYDFSFTPSVVYDKGYFDTIPDVHKELGCDPDYDATRLDPTIPNVPPDNKTTMRTGAGHIHVGFVDKKDPLDPVHFWDCAELARSLNKVLYPASKLWDGDTSRNKLYGKGAAFRPKPYGMEYRSPSNAWLNYPKLWSWLFETTKEILHRTIENDQRMAEFTYLNPVYMNVTLKAFQDVARRIKMPLMPEDWKVA